jgi:hypothetical protein
MSQSAVQSTMRFLPTSLACLATSSTAWKMRSGARHLLAYLGLSLPHVRSRALPALLSGPRRIAQRGADALDHAPRSVARGESAGLAVLPSTGHLPGPVVVSQRGLR